MSNTLQTYVAKATQKAGDDLKEALLRLPEDKRDWSPEGKARTALDQVAECAALNSYTQILLDSRRWPEGGYEAFMAQRAELLALGTEGLLAKLQEYTDSTIAAIGTVADETLGEEVAMPWGAYTVADVIGFAYWNMTYHTGQINYIASMLGCLD